MSAIKPFTVTISQTELDDLKGRLANTRWPNVVEDTGWERGVPVAYLKKIAKHWQTTYDWREAEQKLNKYPQFTTEIDGQTIHYIHVKSAEQNATPLLLTHGYPGSIVEMLAVIDPLTDPVKYGGTASDAFDVVIPSMPGLGFSNPVPQPGWETARTAKAYAELMERLKYNQYAIQGSDVGAGICNELCLLVPERIIGAHISTDPTAVAALFDLDKIDASSLDEHAKKKLEALQAAKKDGSGTYLQIQGSRPQTIGYGFTDSPVAQLAWILERFKEWANDKAELPEEDVDIDTLLTNVSVYWFTKSGASSAHMIYNSQHAQGNWGMPTVPMGFAVFNNTPIVRLALDPQHQHKHWSEFSEGGHFPALEAPKQLVGDIRLFFREIRK